MHSLKTAVNRKEQSQGLPDTKQKICCQRIPGAETAHTNFTPADSRYRAEIQWKRQNKESNADRKAANVDQPRLSEVVPTAMPGGTNQKAK